MISQTKLIWLMTWFFAYLFQSAANSIFILYENRFRPDIKYTYKRQLDWSSVMVSDQSVS